MHIDALLKKVAEKYQQQPQSTTDGLKIEFGKDWLHLRRSNTESVIRIYSESATSQRADELAQDIINDIKDFLPQNNVM